MRHKNKRWLFFWIVWGHFLDVLASEESSSDNFANESKDGRSIFSPRMDYEQWKPLGRGDPLKNDPTYDYVPPVLDRVHYWIDPALRKPDPPLPGENKKTEILLLGVSSKKPSTGTSTADSRKDTYDSFLKFVEGPKFSRPHYPITPSLFPQSFHKNKITFPKEQRMPYTMLMPPPLITKKPIPIQPQDDNSTTTATPVVNTMTSPLVTVQASNLVYQSSSLGDFNEWKSTETSTNLTPNPAVSSTKKIKPFKEDLVFQKHLQPPEPYIQIPFAPPTRRNITSKPLQAANSDVSINYVTPPPFIEEEIMHKGQVSDDNLDPYVKIGKTEADLDIPKVVVFPPLTQTPLTMQTLQSMQTMQPPPPTTSPIYKKSTNPILQALEKEKTVTEDSEEMVESTTTTMVPTTTTTSLTTDPLFKHYKQPMEPLRGPLYLIIQGHSKVKTYGPSKQFHGIRVQESNEISDEREEVGVRHLHGYSNSRKVEVNSREGRSGDLQTLKHVIETGLGAIDFSNVEANRRRDEVKEAEVEFGYKVGGDVTSEKYHKGIVEEARKFL